MALRRLNGCHVIAAYILIETEAGEAATVAAALRDLPGVSETAMGVALPQGLAELGRCGLAGHGDGSSPTVSGRSEEMPDGFADRRTAAA